MVGDSVWDEKPLAGLSPSYFAKIGVAVGSEESDEFKRQSREMAALWGAPESLIVPGHHFSMLVGLNGGALLELALSLTRG